MGKKVKRKKRDNVITFTVSEDEKKSIVDCALRLDMSLSDYIRKTLLRNVTLLMGDGERGF